MHHVRFGYLEDSYTRNQVIESHLANKSAAMILVASNAPLVRSSEAKVSGTFLRLSPISASDQTRGKADSTITSDSASPVQSKPIRHLSFSKTCSSCRTKISRPKWRLRSFRGITCFGLVGRAMFSESSLACPAIRWAKAVSHLCQYWARFFANSQYDSIAQHMVPRSWSSAFSRMCVPNSRSAHDERRRMRRSIIAFASASRRIDTCAVKSLCGPTMSIVCF